MAEEKKTSLLRPSYLFGAEAEKQKNEKNTKNFNDNSQNTENTHFKDKHSFKRNKRNDFQDSFPKKKKFNNNNRFNNDGQNKGYHDRNEFKGFTSEVPCTKNKRQYTISIAVPASILQQTCLLEKLKTYVVGQVSRAACIYNVDEIIVYNDNTWRSSNAQEFEGYLSKFLSISFIYLLTKTIFTSRIYENDFRIPRMSSIYEKKVIPHASIFKRKWCFDCFKCSSPFISIRMVYIQVYFEIMIAI